MPEGRKTMLLQIFSGVLAVFLLFAFPMHGATDCGNALEANLLTFRNASNRHSIAKTLESEPAACACASFRRQTFTKNNGIKSLIPDGGNQYDPSLTWSMNSWCLNENSIVQNAIFIHFPGRFFTDYAIPAKHLENDAVNVRAGPESQTGRRETAES